MTHNPHNPKVCMMFDGAGLAANQQGALSPAQQAALAKDIRRGLFSSLGWLGLLLVALLAGWFAFAAVSQTSEVVPPGVLHGLETFLLFCWALLAVRSLVSIARALDALALVPTLRIAWGDGVLVRDGSGGYAARIPGLPDFTRAWDRKLIQNLLPGVYRFYFLPSNRWLLSAESLGGADANLAAEITRQAAVASGATPLAKAIATANGFSLPALAANSAGHLAPDQASWALTKDRRQKLWAAIAGACLLGLASLLMLGSATGTPVMNYLLAGFLMLVSLGLFWYAFVARGAYRVDAEEGQVSMIEGVGDKYRRARRYGGQISRVYYYVLAGHKFQVPPEAYQALVPCVPYRFYYLPHSRALINVEPLPGARLTAPLPGNPAAAASVPMNASVSPVESRR